MKTTKTLLITSIASLAFSVSAQAQSYWLQELGANGIYSTMMPTGINNNGDLGGTAIDANETHQAAFRYSGGSISIIATPSPKSHAFASGINSDGTIVGYYMGSTVNHEFYDQPGLPAVDPDQNYSRDSWAKAVNDNGFVVGLYGPAGAAFAPYVGHISGGIWSLSSVLGAHFNPTGLNNNLNIVGNDPNFGGILYNALTDTKTYLGFSLGTWDNHAAAINKNGTIAGWVGKQGFLLTPGGGPVTFFGSVQEVLGMNAKGDVVGQTAFPYRAFVYLKSTNQFLDLSKVVVNLPATWILEEASGINDNGEICGWAYRPSTPADGVGDQKEVTCGFKLTPFVGIPLPWGIGKVVP